MSRRLVNKWTEFCFQFAVAAHFRFYLLVQVNAALVDADSGRTGAVWKATATLVVAAEGHRRLERTLVATILLMHEARIRGVGQSLDIR